MLRYHLLLLIAWLTWPWPLDQRCQKLSWMKRISKWFSHTLFLLAMSPSPSLQRQESYRSGWLFQDTAQVCTGLMGLLSVLDLLGLNQTHRNKGLNPHWPPHPPHRPMVTVDIAMTVSKNRVRVVCSPFLFSVSELTGEYQNSLKSSI